MIIGKRVLHYKEVDSTNEEARRLVKRGEGEGLVVAADMQTEGRGKPGSKWFSPKGNIYLSAVVKPYKNPKDLSPITLLGALAARAAITRASKLPVTIKWPNDLRIHGKKVGGVLTERMPSGHLIIGIGINLNNVPAEVKRAATSLRTLTGKRFEPAKIADSLISELDKEYCLFLKKA